MIRTRDALAEAISIHSPHTRGDQRRAISSLVRLSFQSTPLMRGETDAGSPLAGFQQISIHSPHARGDTSRDSLRSRRSNFNPLPSHEGRQQRGISSSGNSHFNPLPSHEGRQPRRRCRISSGLFQSTPLTRGETRLQIGYLRLNINFNPLPSHEGRQHKPPKIHPDLRQLTQQNHDTPLFRALQAPFCGAKPDVRGAKPTGKP